MLVSQHGEERITNESRIVDGLW